MPRAHKTHTNCADAKAALTPSGKPQGRGCRLCAPLPAKHLCITGCIQWMHPMCVTRCTCCLGVHCSGVHCSGTSHCQSTAAACRAAHTPSPTLPESACAARRPCLPTKQHTRRRAPQSAHHGTNSPGGLSDTASRQCDAKGKPDIHPAYALPANTEAHVTLRGHALQAVCTQQLQTTTSTHTGWPPGLEHA